MTKRIELDDDGDEWIEVNKRVNDAVTERAMSENERFGDALIGYLTEEVTGAAGDDGDDDGDD